MAKKKASKNKPAENPLDDTTRPYFLIGRGSMSSIAEVHTRELIKISPVKAHRLEREIPLYRVTKFLMTEAPPFPGITATLGVTLFKDMGEAKLAAVQELSRRATDAIRVLHEFVETGPITY